MTKQYDNYADLITFTRASTGTYLDSDGLLKTATTNTPRIEYDADGNRLGLLIEEARTNVLVRSEEFDSGSWSKNRATVTADDALAPDGLSTADRIIEGTETGTHQALIASDITADSVNTVSIFVKAGSGSDRAFRIDFRDSTYTDGVGIVFNPHTGVVVGSSVTGAGSNLATSVQNAGNGWYRISLTGKLSAVATSARVILYMQSNLTTFSASYTGDGVSNLLLWGAQLEAGSFPTSYIPTAGATATRAADVASIPTSAFGYNQKAGTVYIEGASSNYQTNRIFQIDDGTNSNRIFFLNGSDRRFYWQRSIGGAGAGGVGSFDSVSNGTYIKFAGAYSDGDWEAALNETLRAGTPSGLPTVDRLNIGSGSGTTVSFNGHIKSIQYYPRRLTNAQLQRLTT